jgi:hypothetical protein
MSDRSSIFWTGVLQIALSFAAFWFVASGWTLWLRIPALTLAVFFGVGGARAVLPAATWPSLPRE